MKLNNLLILFQDFVWDYFIFPIADFFKIECEYCWWWRGVLLGSIFTSLIFILCTWWLK